MVPLAAVLLLAPVLQLATNAAPAAAADVWPWAPAGSAATAALSAAEDFSFTVAVAQRAGGCSDPRAAARTAAGRGCPFKT